MPEVPPGLAWLPMQRSIIFAIDVEPDGRASVRDDPREGLKVALRELSDLRGRIEEFSKERVRFNWFLRFDPQTEQTWGRNWIQDACPELIPWLKQNGDLIGIHTHFWNWDDSRRIWFSDFANSEWRARCLRGAIEGYGSVFGAAPAASRFGDRWLSHELIPLLKNEGIRYDLTLEPGSPGEPPSDDKYASAWKPDHRRAPRMPYRPSAEDYLVPELPSSPSATENPLWLIPLTTTQPPQWGPIRRFPFLMKLSRPFNLVLRPRMVWAHMSAGIDRPGAEPLVFVLRSGDLAQPGFLANFRYIATRLARHPGLKQCRFVGVDEAIRSFEKTQSQEA
jgi:hypothetical protein